MRQSLSAMDYLLSGLLNFELIPRIKSIINKEEELSIEEQMEAIAAAEIADAKE